VPIAYISHPSSLLHDMGPYHPECPDRLRAIGDRLIAAGLDAYLSHYAAPAATHEQLARVHGEGYIATIEAECPRRDCISSTDTAMTRIRSLPRACGGALGGDGSRHAR
jgi:acetoin utilization deacetylase AcuC-like enzyme